MDSRTRRIQYFYATVKDEPGAAYRFLTQLASAEVNLLAFQAIPMGPGVTQLVLFPENVERLAHAAETTGIVLTGPHTAFVVQGTDRLGALVDVHEKLSAARINVYASWGVTDGRGGYGYVFLVRPEDYERSAALLGV